MAVLSSEFIPLRLSLQVLAWSQLSKEPWAVRNPIRRAGGTHGSCWLWLKLSACYLSSAPHWAAAAPSDGLRGGGSSVKVVAEPLSSPELPLCSCMVRKKLYFSNFCLVRKIIPTYEHFRYQARYSNSSLPRDSAVKWGFSPSLELSHAVALRCTSGCFPPSALWAEDVLQDGGSVLVRSVPGGLAVRCVRVGGACWKVLSLQSCRSQQTSAACSRLQGNLYMETAAGLVGRKGGLWPPLALMWHCCP